MNFQFCIIKIKYCVYIALYEAVIIFDRAALHRVARVSLEISTVIYCDPDFILCYVDKSKYELHDIEPFFSMDAIRVSSLPKMSTEEIVQYTTQKYYFRYVLNQGQAGSIDFGNSVRRPRSASAIYCNVI